jgi:hypothetical protein
MAGARWVNALLFGLNIFLVGLWVANMGAGLKSTNIWLPLVGSLLVLTAPTMLEIHSMAWTEAVFLFCAFSGLFFLAIYFQRFDLGSLVLAAILISLAFLSRYAGAALIAAGFLGIILFSSQSFKKRVVSAGLFAFIGILPATLWILRNLQSAGTATSREIGFHPIGLSHLKDAMTTISSWALIPVSASLWIKVIPLVGLSLAFLVVIFSRQNQADQNSGKRKIVALPIMVKLLLVFSLTYLAFLAFSISFIDANTPLDSRILSPLHISGVILVLYLVKEFLARSPNSLGLKASLIIAGVFLLASNAWTGLALIRDGYEHGIGFNNLSWSRSELLSEAEKLPDEVVIYTNAPEAVYFFFDRAALSIPRKIESTSRQPNPNYLADLADMRSVVEDGQGVILYFSSLNRPTLVSEEELKTYIPFCVAFEADGGTIYGMDDCS